jgi:hypothetical protein
MSKTRTDSAAGRWQRLERAAAKVRDARIVSRSQERRRKTLSGRTMAGQTTPWRILPGPRVTGGSRSDRGHPSRKHDVAMPLAVIEQPAKVHDPDLPRRRDRRPAMVAAAKADLELMPSDQLQRDAVMITGLARAGLPITTDPVVLHDRSQRSLAREVLAVSTLEAFATEAVMRRHHACFAAGTIR